MKLHSQNLKTKISMNIFPNPQLSLHAPETATVVGWVCVFSDNLQGISHFLHNIYDIWNHPFLIL